MPSWTELVENLNHVPKEDRPKWVQGELSKALTSLSKKRDGNNVLIYASGFLQKPQVGSYFVNISHEDINGYMSVMHGMDWEKPLSLVLHTPGGVTNATETIVEYLHQKFPRDIEVIIPTYAMSAGTMISLAANRIVMGRHSQLGPIDPFLPGVRRADSARAIVNQFESAKKAILADRTSATVWAPIMQSLGPSLLTEASDALDYGETMVKRWLGKRMFAACEDRDEQAARVAEYFNRSPEHTSHGRRIGREEASEQGVNVEELERDQDLQEVVLTVYHLTTLIFEQSPCAKFIAGNHGRFWIKNVQTSRK